MNKMTIGLAALATMAIVGCNSSDGGGGSSVKLKTPTYTISESNRFNVDSVTYDYAAEADAVGMLDNTTSRSLPLRSFLGLSVLQPRNIAARINESETISCDSGSITISVSGSGVNENTGELNSSGSLTMSFGADKCRVSNVEEDGLISLSMSWSGYDGSNFDNLSLDITFDDYTSKDFDGSGAIASSELVHGFIGMSLNNNETAMSMKLSLSSSEIDNKIINIETTSDIKQRNSDFYPYSGVLVVTGGNGTKVTYTVVSNGVEVSLNDGQPELITWD